MLGFEDHPQQLEGPASSRPGLPGPSEDHATHQARPGLSPSDHTGRPAVVCCGALPEGLGRAGSGERTFPGGPWCWMGQAARPEPPGTKRHTHVHPHTDPGPSDTDPHPHSLSHTGTRTPSHLASAAAPTPQAGLAVGCGFLGNPVTIMVAESQGPPACARQAPWSPLGPQAAGGHQLEAEEMTRGQRGPGGQGTSPKRLPRVP